MVLIICRTLIKSRNRGLILYLLLLAACSLHSKFLATLAVRNDGEEVVLHVFNQLYIYSSIFEEFDFIMLVEKRGLCIVPLLWRGQVRSKKNPSARSKRGLNIKTLSI